MATTRQSLLVVASSFGAAATDYPFWGCGLLGPLHGIQADGTTTPAMQTMIDALKSTNKYSGKVTYWDWNYAPQIGDDGSPENLTQDFLFMPENWGVQAVTDEYVRPANAQGFLDSLGRHCPAQMADIFLGANEPDIIGSCMGDMMGICTGPCPPGEMGDCPVGHAKAPQGSGHANPNGHCDCWSDDHATGAGFWTVPNISQYQPLPTCWTNPECVSVVMSAWKQSAAIVAAKGYKYLSTPLIAVDMDWMQSFVKEACNGCSDMSCGCPTHLAWHFYANDCQPETGGYAHFQSKLDATVALMNQFPHLMGAIINEVGMLNCAMDTPSAVCKPNGPDQKYPAQDQPNHTCPPTPSMPKGLASYLEKLMDMVAAAKAADGRRAVVSFTWFNENMNGGTYNQQLFDDDGSINQIGESYMASCKQWAASVERPSEVIV